MTTYHYCLSNLNNKVLVIYYHPIIHRLSTMYQLMLLILILIFFKIKTLNTCVPHLHFTSSIKRAVGLICERTGSVT